MPNYVRNLINIVSGDFQAVADFMKSEERGFDFNNLVQMPKVFYQWNVVSDLDEIGAAFWLVLYQGNDKEEERAITEITTLRDDLICYVIHNGYKRFLAYLETGYIDSYYWAQDKWGTKWNAFDVDVNPSDRKIFFNTAWSAPIPIYKALAKQFPKHIISVKYYDEGGCFAGYADIKDGTAFGEDYECDSTQGKAIINEINCNITKWY